MPPDYQSENAFRGLLKALPSEGLAQRLAARHDRAMADEPGNLTLKLLREIRAEQAAMREDIAGVRVEQAAVREDLKEVRAEQHALALLLGKVSDAVTAIAATQEHHSQVLARHSELFGQVIETQQSHGGRLNAIESRLALIEKHTGLVKA
jgi:hypothetical protein